MTSADGPLAGLRASFDMAERFAREVSEFRSNVPVPAYNQLRYAGYHLLKALDDRGRVVDEAQVEKAVGHCERAMYDAAEAGLIQVVRELVLFRLEYRSIRVSEVVPTYSEMLVRARRAQALVVEGRNRRGSVEQHVQRYMEAFRILAEDLELLNASRDDLNAVRTRRIVETRRFWTRLAVIAAVPIVLALLF